MMIVVHKRTPSQNEWHGKHQGAHYVPIKLEWYILLRHKLVPREQETRPMRLTINTYRRRLLDTGNLWGGTKPIPDCIKRLGYIKDDSPQWCKFHVEQFKVDKKYEERTEIILEPWNA